MDNQNTQADVSVSTLNQFINYHLGRIATLKDYRSELDPILNLNLYESTTQRIRENEEIIRELKSHHND